MSITGGCISALWPLMNAFQTNCQAVELHQSAQSAYLIYEDAVVRIPRIFRHSVRRIRLLDRKRVGTARYLLDPIGRKEETRVATHSLDEFEIDTDLFVSHLLKGMTIDCQVDAVVCQQLQLIHSQKGKIEFPRQAASLNFIRHCDPCRRELATKVRNRYRQRFRQIYQHQSTGRPVGEENGRKAAVCG